MFCEVGRFQGHFVGDPQGYRGEGELDELKTNHDCLQNFRARISESGELDIVDLDAIDAEVMALVEEAVVEAKSAPRPQAADVDSDVYVNYAQGGA